MKLLQTNYQIFLLPCFILLFSTSGVQAQEENFKVFDSWVEWSNGENMLQLYLNKQGYTFLDQREKEIAQLKTVADWELRQQKVKGILSEIVGKFPEKTPLNPKITGTIHRNGFRVEKLIYESMPGFYVTGCLFIPDGTGKKPAILNVIGHSTQSFRRDVYQNIILNLVTKGFIVLAIDPLGQGEMLQYFDPETKKSAIGSSTSEHSYIANQCFLSGYSLAKYFIWDGIRGIDYLLTRDEVDPERIGLTGLSGGGTQTAFIGAFDDRIKATAPTCYITSYRRLLESEGVQDGEQNFYHGLARGIDHADLLEARIPKPTLLVATTKDFFSIQGARETYTEVKKAYKTFDREGQFNMSEADYHHGFVRKNNEAVYAFFQKELELPGNPSEEEIEFFAESELNVTPTGQLSTSYKGKIVFDLNKPVAEKLNNKLRQSRQSNPSHLEIVKQKAKELSGYVIPESGGIPVFRGRYQREGYSVELYAVKGDEDYVIPLLLAIPDGDGNYPAVIYTHPEGKEEGIAKGGNIEKLVKQGYIVAVPDVLGIGETKSNRAYPGSHGYGAQLVGRSIVGIQAGDIIRVVNFLKKVPNVEAGAIKAIAFGEQCPALLHAVAFEPSISSLALIEAPVSYYDITQTRMYRYTLSFNWGVAGVLTAYDLPDLAACIAPRKVLFAGLLNGEKEPASETLINNEMSYPKSVYAKRGIPENLRIIPISEGLIDKVVEVWKEEGL